MTYAAGAAYYHRLPAMRSIFKGLIDELIHKMLLREVWGYWYLTSQSGTRCDPDLKELPKPWADAVRKENIMVHSSVFTVQWFSVCWFPPKYSGHLLLMVSLYSMLFNDDKYDKEDAIVFNWNPLFFRMGPKRFSYTRSTLQKHSERDGAGKLDGVCCEPNMVFIICNQFPIIATRYNDIRNGNNIVDEILPKYKAAWARKGMLSENGLFRSYYSPKRDAVVDSEEIGHSAWVMTYMPWNYTQIKSMYPSTGVGFLHRVDGRINIHPPVVTNAIKNIVATEGGHPPNKKPYLAPTFGWVAQWLSEVAGPDALEALLPHADTYLKPSWSNGGLYYARCDTGCDEDGNYTYVEPYTGNAAIGYARRNVKDGQKKMWDSPWTGEDVERRPYIDRVGLEMGVDCLRGRWDEELGFLRATFRSWNGERVVIKPVVKGLPRGTFGVYVDGKRRMTVNIASRDEEVAVELEVAEVEVDLVVLRA